jgi:predicted extracellular nuclease
VDEIKIVSFLLFSLNVICPGVIAMKKLLLPLLMAATAPLANAAATNVFITEWAYQGAAGEYVELTNLGSVSIDFTNWVYDDDSRSTTTAAGASDLSSFGVVAAGESVIFTESDANAFRTFWGLSNTVKVLGGITNNLSRNDEINIYDNLGTLVDRLTYGDQSFPGTIRTNISSGRAATSAALGANDASQWVLSTAGDIEGSINLGGTIGSPGHTSHAPEVPVPAAAWLFGSALAGLLGSFRRRKA